MIAVTGSGAAASNPAVVQDAPHGAAPLIVHLVYHFDTGGLENGIVNLINHMRPGRYRHAIIALCGIGELKNRIQRDGIIYVALDKPPGHALRLYPKLYRLLRQLRPAIVHTRNLAALECVVPAWTAGVPVRIHGEHGRDVGDLDGRNVKYQRLRRLYRPFVTHYVALSRDLSEYLTGPVKVAPDQVTRLCNGVDTERFHPAGSAPEPISGCPFRPDEHWLIGTVGRMQHVKDQTTLARAFTELLRSQPALKEKVRLVLVGDGPLRAECRQLLESAGLADLAWLPGERNDVPQVMRGLNAFVLPSLAEGISNTILEAMACGLPVLATDVGGNAELIAAGSTGEIVPAADPSALAQVLLRWATAPEAARQMGATARTRALQQFSVDAMVQGYQTLYDRLLDSRAPGHSTQAG